MWVLLRLLLLLTYFKFEGNLFLGVSHLTRGSRGERRGCGVTAVFKAGPSQKYFHLDEWKYFEILDRNVFRPPTAFQVPNLLFGTDISKG